MLRGGLLMWCNEIGDQRTPYPCGDYSYAFDDEGTDWWMVEFHSKGKDELSELCFFETGRSSGTPTRYARVARKCKQ